MLDNVIVNSLQTKLFESQSIYGMQLYFEGFLNLQFCFLFVNIGDSNSRFNYINIILN